MKKWVVSLGILFLMLTLFSARAFSATKEFPLTYAPNWIYKFSFVLKLSITKEGRVSARVKKVKPVFPKAYIWMKFSPRVTRAFWYDKCIYINFNLAFKGQGRAVSIPLKTTSDPSTYKWDGPQKGVKVKEWNQNSQGVDASFCVKDFPELAGIKEFTIQQPHDQVVHFDTSQPVESEIPEHSFIRRFKGTVQIKRAGTNDWVQVKKGLRLGVGDELRTLSDGRAYIVLASSAFIRLKPNSHIVIPKRKENSRKKIGFLELTVGVIMAQARKERNGFKVGVPQAICGLRGTRFEVSYINGVSCVKVFEHSVWFSDRPIRHTVVVHEGEKSCVVGKGVPSPPVAFDDGETENTPLLNISGKWRSNFGEITLQQQGKRVTGHYTHDHGKIDGTLHGNILTGKWREAPTYKPPHDAGDFEFTFSKDGKSFSGHWRYGFGGSSWNGSWSGERQPPSGL